MRILYVSHDFLPGHPAGTEIYTWQLAKRVQERGHEVAVFTTEKDIARPHLRVDRREWDGLPVFELINNLFYDDFRETWDWPPAVDAFGKLLDKLHPDVVHVMHLLYLSIGCVEEAARRGIPVIYTLHDYWLSCARFGQRIHDDDAVCHEIDFDRCGSCLATLKYAQSSGRRRSARLIAGVRSATGIDLGPAARGAANLLAGRGPKEYVPPDPAPAAQMAKAARARDDEIRARLLPKVAKFVAPSRFLRDQLVAWGIPETQIEHVMYGLELAPFRDFARTAAEKTRISFIGTLAPHKGPHLVFEAWGSLPEALKAKGTLTVWGPKTHHPAYVAELEKLAATHGGTLAGGLKRDEIPGALANTDLLVVPSTWYENSPLTIHEARATRTPLLVSDFGGMAELVEPEVDGWRFEMGSRAAIAARLEKILADPTCLDALPRDGEPVKEMTKSAEEMEERYAALLGKTP